MGGSEPSHPQMPKSTSADSCPRTAPRSSVDARADGDRVHSHGQASMSLLCGFKWVFQHLQKTMEEKRCWDNSSTEGGFDEHHYCLHCIEVDRGSIRHIIGAKGGILRKTEDF